MMEIAKPAAALLLGLAAFVATSKLRVSRERDVFERAVFESLALAPNLGVPESAPYLITLESVQVTRKVKCWPLQPLL